MKYALRAVAIFFCASSAVIADGVQPIVPTGQVTYGSAQKSLTSTSDVVIDTATHRFWAKQGIKSPSITFNDGSVLTSTSGISASAAWGSITGTLSNQSDLNTRLNLIGTSTASLQSQVTTLSLSTAALRTSINSIGVATGTLQTSIYAIGVTTGSLQTQITAQGVTLATIGTSTASLQTQINQGRPVSLSTGVTGILPTANMVSTVSFTTANQTFTGTNAWTGPAVSTFTNGVDVGSMTIRDLTASQFVTTNGAKKLSSVDLYNSSPTWTGTHTFNGAGPYVFNSTISLKGLQITNVLNAILTTDGLGIVRSTSTVSLASQVSGNLPVTNLASGTGATSSTFWRGDGTWAAPATTSGGSSLAVGTGTVTTFVKISSPTTGENFNRDQFSLQLTGGSTIFISINTSSITAQGNTFNAANQLVKLSAGGQYPAIDGNLITNLNTNSLVGINGNQVPYSAGFASGLIGSDNFQFNGTSMTLRVGALLAKTTIQYDNTTWTPNGWSAEESNGLTIMGNSVVGSILTGMKFGAYFGSNPSTYGTFGMYLQPESNSGSNNGGYYFTSSTGAAIANINSFGIHAGTSRGMNSIDAYNGLAVGRNFTTTGALRIGILPIGITAPQDGAAIEGNVLIGTGTQSATPANLHIVTNTNNTYGILISSSFNALGWSVGFSTKNGAQFRNASRWEHNYKGTGADGQNVFLGENAGNFTMGDGTNQGGSWNIGIGGGSLSQITTGYANVGIGYASLFQLSYGAANTVVGYESGNFLTTGNVNTAVGSQSLQNATSTTANTAVGAGALQSATTGIGGNVAVGYRAGIGITSGYYNNAIGLQALQNVTTGYSNIAIGQTTFGSLIGGTGNIGIGEQAGVSEYGSNNIYIGTNAGPSSISTLSNAIAIGVNASVSTSNTMVIGADSSPIEVRVSTMTFSGNAGMSSRTLAQLSAMTPTSVGQMFYCTTCTTDGVVQSTGTGRGAWSRITSKTTAIQ